MMSWPKTTKQSPCPKCGHTDGSCRFSPDGAMLLCLRIESGCIVRTDGSKMKAKGGMGHYHRLASNGNGHKPVKTQPKPVRKLTATECKNIILEHQSDCDESKYKLGYDSLGISIESLKAFGMGWDRKTACLSFPMVDGVLKPVGIRLRSPDGTVKRTVLNSSNGIFVPTDYATFCPPEFCDAQPLLLLIPEGPTDSGALRDMGFRAIGRPSNMGGAEQIRDLLKRDPPRMRQDVVIVIDNDPTKWSRDGIPFVPGWEGGLHLADYCIPFANTLRIIRPPGFNKDVRKWAIGGGNADILTRLINEAELVTRKLLNEKLASMADFKIRGHADWLKRNGNGNGQH